VSYGIPYMGSKSSICEELCSIFPRAENFYDLFGGGFSITHFMLKHRSSHYKQFHFNEIRPGVCELIKEAIAGRYSYDVYLPPWISRDEFHARKESEPMVNLFWSFGNDGRSYMFGKDIEQYKRSLHNAVVFNEFDATAREVLGMDRFRDGFTIKDRRLFLRAKVRQDNPGMRRGLLPQLQQLQHLQELRQLERIQRLKQLERQPAFYSGDYRRVEIKPNSVIYCDIPYGGTKEYDKNKAFDRAEFLDWADARAEPVYISEYAINDARFKCISNHKKISKMSANKDTAVIKIEKVYVNRAGYARLMSSRRTAVAAVVAAVAAVGAAVAAASNIKQMEK